MAAMRIFDFHTYLGASPHGEYARTAEELIADMDACGIEAAVVAPLCDTPGPDDDAHRRLHAACRRYPGRLVAFARLDPRYGARAAAALDAAADEWGFKGVLFNPVSCDSLPYLPAVVALMARAAEKGLPVLIPAGQGYTALPEQIALLAAKLPELKVVIGHMGSAAHATRAMALLAEHPNLYLETSVQQSPYRVALLADAARAGRVLFGSGAPYSHPEVELLKLRRAGLPADALERLMGANARRLLGLDGEVGR